MRKHLAVLLVSSLTTLGAAGCGEPTEEPNEPADAGVAIDSGPEQDAGSQADASLPDAGLDAGWADAGSLDAGSAVDAGAIDAGPCAAWPNYDYAAPDCGPKPMRVQFDGTKAIDDTGLDVYRVLWTFGDGQTSSATNPAHTYQQAGDYEASVALTADLGGTDFTMRRTGIKIRVHAP